MSVDRQTQRLLRALGEAALRVADGGSINDQLIERLLDSEGPAHVLEQPPLLTVNEVCARLQISRWSFYRLIHQRQLNTISIGRRRFVPRAELHRFVAALSDGGTR